MMKNLFAFAALLAVVSCGSRTGGKWVSLMPDKDFSNWDVQTVGLDSSTGQEAVLSGNGIMLYGAPGAPIPEFRNFVLSAEVFTTPDAVSSLWFHRGHLPGYEIVLGNNRLGKGELQKRGSLNNVRNIYKSMVPDGEWFALEITVKGKNIVVRIDDITVVDYVEPTEPYRLIENRYRTGVGTFALETHEGTTRFRNMKVMGLPDDALGRTDAVDERTDRVIRLQQAGFPVIDFHVHLKGWSQDDAMDNSRKTGIFYGIAPNCGIGFPITSDADIDNFIDTTRNLPAFMAMQGEGREWVGTFSRESMKKFDYVFTDALTFTDHNGRRVRLWIDEEVVIDIPQEEYMDIIVDRTIDVITGEPIDIFVNPCFLPTAMLDNYDELWTEARIKKVVEALAANGVALEINARYRIPNAAIIKAAMDAGVKLAFGTNNGNAAIGKLEYCFEMMDECGIRAEHMFFPGI